MKAKKRKQPKRPRLAAGIANERPMFPRPAVFRTGRDYDRRRFRAETRAARSEASG